MTLQSMDCPKCGGKIEMDLTGKKFIFCPFCGEQIAVVDENVKTININKIIKQESINHTKMAELEYKKQKEKSEDRVGWIIVICMFVIPIVALIIWGVTDTLILPRYNSWQFKKNSVIAAESGLICAGSSSEYKEKDWRTVAKQFEDLGFTNVSHTKMSGFHPFAAGQVQEVSINGRPDFSFKDYFEPDVPIIISHY